MILFWIVVSFIALCGLLFLAIGYYVAVLQDREFWRRRALCKKHIDMEVARRRKAGELA